MDYREDYQRERRYRDQGDFRGSERRDRDRRDRGDYERRRGDDRGFLERLVEELRSWFRDEDARRGRRDEREPERRWGGGDRGWGAGPDEDVDRGWARQWGYVDREDMRERRGDLQRPRSASTTRGFGGEGYGSEQFAGDRYYEPRSGWGDPSGWGPEPGAPPRWSDLGGSERPGRFDSGPHAGRGPRNYQRADDRIREDVCDVLCDHGYIDASDIEVTVLNGEVTLIGLVPDRPQKRMAEDAAEQVSGVREVHNQLRVSPGASGQEPQGRPGDPRFRVA
jgi:BON domain-containing protein